MAQSTFQDLNLTSPQPRLPLATRPPPKGSLAPGLTEAASLPSTQEGLASASFTRNSWPSITF